MTQKEKQPEPPHFFICLSLVLAGAMVLVLNLLIPSAHATAVLNLTYIPEGLAEQLSITEFSAGILAGVIMLFLIMLPVAIVEGTQSHWGKLIIGISILGFEIAVGWMPTYFLMLIGLLCTLMLSAQAREWLSGG